MNRVTKRYLVTLLAGIAALAAAGLCLALVLNSPSFKDSKTAGGLAGIGYMTVWMSVAGFVAKEKGRTLLWILMVWLAPLQVVLLLLPHTPERRAELKGQRSATQPHFATTSRPKNCEKCGGEHGAGSGFGGMVDQCSKCGKYVCRSCKQLRSYHQLCPFCQGTNWSAQ